MSSAHRITLLSVAGALAATGFLLAVPTGAGASAPLLPAAPLCFEQEATIVGDGTGTVVGTEGDDVIVTTGGRVEALGGDDLVCGALEVDAGEGDDRVSIDAPDGGGQVDAGTGDDVVFVRSPWPPSKPKDPRVGSAVDGGEGDDLLVGGASDDRLDGGPGSDEMRGELGRDFVDGGPGYDYVGGGGGHDGCAGELMGGCDGPLDPVPLDTPCFGETPTIMSGEATDNTKVFGTEGDDVIRTRGGKVRAYGGDDRVCGAYEVFGGEGDDQLEVAWGDWNDWSRGGPGDDWMIDTSPPGFQEFNTVRMIGGSGDDELVGGSRVHEFFGQSGDDVLRPGAGDDSLSGGAGNDILESGDGADLLRGDDGDDRIDGGPDDDDLHGGRGQDYLDGGEGLRDRAWGGRDRDRDECTNVFVARNCELVRN